MRGRVIHKNDLVKIVDCLRRSFRVVAPFEGRGRDSYFDEVTDANRASIAIHVANPYYPPKRYVLPHLQRLLKYQTGTTPSIEEVAADDKIAVFGMALVRRGGIFHLDRFYLGNTFRDPYYEQLRQNIFIVNMVCTDLERDIDEDCFCVSPMRAPRPKLTSICNSWTCTTRAVSFSPWPGRRRAKRFSSSLFSVPRPRRTLPGGARCWMRYANGSRPPRVGIRR